MCWWLDRTVRFAACGRFVWWTAANVFESLDALRILPTTNSSATTHVTNKWRLIAICKWIMRVDVQRWGLWCRYNSFVAFVMSSNHTRAPSSFTPNDYIDWFSIKTRSAPCRLWLWWLRLSDIVHSFYQFCACRRSFWHHITVERYSVDQPSNEFGFVYGFHSVPIKRTDRMQSDQCGSLNSYFCAQHAGYNERKTVYLIQFNSRLLNATKWCKVISEHKRCVERSSN